MPRRQFIADLQKALGDGLPTGVLNVRAGDDDGQFEFEFTAASSATTLSVNVNVTAMVTDVSEYPSSHDYMLFCGEDAPHAVAQALQDIRNTGRKTISELISLVAACLSALSPDTDGDHMMGESISDDDEEQYEEDEDADDIYDDDDESFSFGDPVLTAATVHLPATPQATAATKGDKLFRDRVRSDLRAAKEAGFRVGHLGNLLEGCSSFVTISIRMSKLHISEEAMQAWKVDPSEYFILVIQYPNGYKTNEQFQAYDGLRLKPNVGMRVFAGNYYKPTLQQAIKAFTKARKEYTSGQESLDNSGKDDDLEERYIHDTFISKPLSRLLEENLVPILRFRSTGMDWSGAEAWYHDVQQASSTGDPDAVPDEYYEPERVKKSLPNIMQGDQYRERNVLQYSFPTLAMQFSLRHFVRCTEFCLVCHRKLDGELQAIKPYVCERPLCLFQYMSLGFGPSIEHEILSQPHVVDLLVSFCYSSARSTKLKEFPDGLNLMCPPRAWQEPPKAWTGYDTPVHDQQIKSSTTDCVPYEIGFDRVRREIIFFNKPKGGCPVARGQWLVIRWGPGNSEADKEELHCRVSDTSYYPTISVDEPVSVSLTSNVIAEYSKMTQRPVTTVDTSNSTVKWCGSFFLPYCQDFDELDYSGKCQAICKLIDLLPSVDDMRKYLIQNHPTDLRSWVERMPRDVTNLLRWIIASNRACIMQADSDDLGGKAKGVANHKEERLYGVDGYMQFRFVMGAPDKETRFVSEVRKTTDRLGLKFPTIFAWHGSPLWNWHMIIREGLHFKNTDHGRAYGHGVYFARDAGTSTGYSGMGSAVFWPKSKLRVTGALALNEIVNAPKEFVSSSPFYVVPQLDWIQTRYLLVKCAPTDENIKPSVEVKPKHAHPQDPFHTPTGTSSAGIIIPASAIKTKRVEPLVEKDDKRLSQSLVGGASKKLKGGFGNSVATAIELDDEDTASIDTDVEDVEILFPETEPQDVAMSSTKGQQLGNGKGKAEPATDYIPGSLDFSTLPVMPMPTYATSATTKRLLSELSSLAKVQANNSLATLGWTIDTEKIENVYQWIVELHSFHTFSINNKPLPLVGDMKKANATSIVLEIRFGPDFPYSPPYIRVIRPRFLPFTQGGGGHIVIGGAMCMELLTNSGWSSVMSMESVLMQVRMAIASEPFARLEGKGYAKHNTNYNYDYGVMEAADGYLRACNSHGWQVPPGFKEIAYGMKTSQTDAGANA